MRFAIAALQIPAKTAHSKEMVTVPTPVIIIGIHS
jgi:hypothetical protein